MNVTDKLHVLLVEDQRAVAASIQTFIEARGHRVTCVATGEAAVAAYVADSFDVVLMDIIMPGMGGIEATRRIKEIQSNRWVPIIMLTALGGDNNLITGLDAGADEYMVKPIQFDVLEARIRAMHRIAGLQRTLAGVIANVIEGIVLIDAHGTIRSFNHAAEAIFGYREAEIIGRNVSTLMASPHREQHDGYISHYLATGVPRVIGRKRRLEAQRKSGEVFPIYLGVTEVDTPEGMMFVGLIHDISEEEQLRRNIEYMAWHDSLTGLPNRSLLYRQIERLLKPEGRESGGRFALLYIDLDGFKPVNDSFGHHAGDEVLRIVGERMRNALARSDLVARVGGDEFVVVAIGASAGAARRIGERLLAALHEAIEVAGQRLTLGASVGIASYPEHGRDLETLMQAADDAMYDAKHGGGARIAIVDGAATEKEKP